MSSATPSAIRALWCSISLLALPTARVDLAIAQLPPALVGTWRLVSFDGPDSTGSQRAVWGGRAVGLLVYTADGHVSAQLYDGRPVPRTGNRASVQGSGEPNSSRLITYFGTVSIDSSRRLVSHHVINASGRDLIGTTLVRAYRFVGPDTIELRVVPAVPDPPGRNRAVLVWERVRP